MSRARWLILLLPLLAMLPGVWLLTLPPSGVPRTAPAPAPAEHAPQSPAARPSSPDPASGLAVDTSEPLPAGVADSPDSPWRITGRIHDADGSRQLLRDAHETIEVWLAWQEPCDDANAGWWYVHAVRLRPDEQSFELWIDGDACDSDFATHRWALVVQRADPHEQVRDGDSERLDDRRRIVRPTVTGQHLDFGTIDVSLGDCIADNETVVRGRLMHISGEPVGHTQRVGLLITTEDDERDPADADDGEPEPLVIVTDADGRFTRVVPRQPWPVRARLVGPATGSSLRWSSEPTSTALDKSVVDLGTFTAAGALLRFRITLPDPEVMQRDGSEITIVEDDGHVGPLIRLHEAPADVSILLPAGRTMLGAFVHIEGEPEDDRSGCSDAPAWRQWHELIVLSDGEVRVFDLDFPKPGTVPVRMADGVWAQLHWSIWRNADDAYPLAWGWQEGPCARVVPTLPRCETRVSEHDTRGVAHHGDRDVTMHPLEDAERRIEVFVEVPPEVVGRKVRIMGEQGHLRNGATIQLGSSRYQGWFSARELGGGEGILLVSEDDLGYPNRVMAGPVAVPAEGVVARLIAGPMPWATAAEHVYLDVTCGGHDVRFVGNGLSGGRLCPVPGWDDDCISFRSVPDAILDSADPDHRGRLIGTRITAPTVKHPVASVSVDLPVRVLVRSVDDSDGDWVFTLESTEHRGGTVSTTGDPVDHQACLWAPPGPARLTGTHYRSDTVLQRDLTITTDTQTIDWRAVTDATVRVWFDPELPTPGERHRDCAWTMVDATSGLVVEDVERCTTIDRARRVPPGRYWLVPESDPDAAFEVEVGLPERAIRLPRVGPPAESETGDLLLRFDTAVFGAMSVEVATRVAVLSPEPLRGRCVEAWDRDHDYGSVWRITGEGLLVRRLPLHRDLMLAVDFRPRVLWEWDYRNARAPTRMMIGPLRLRLASPYETRTATIQPCIYADLRCVFDDVVLRAPFGRLPPGEFDVISETGRHDGRVRVNADATGIVWPRGIRR